VTRKCNYNLIDSLRNVKKCLNAHKRLRTKVMPMNTTRLQEGPDSRRKTHTLTYTLTPTHMHIFKAITSAQLTEAHNSFQMKFTVGLPELFMPIYTSSLVTFFGRKTSSHTSWYPHKTYKMKKKNESSCSREFCVGGVLLLFTVVQTHYSVNALLSSEWWCYLIKVLEVKCSATTSLS